MWFLVVFGSLFLAASGQMYVTDDIEMYIKNALEANETIKFDFESYKGNPCAPYTSEMPNYNNGVLRTSEIKCLEYIWHMRNRENETDSIEVCRHYILSHIKKGIFPELPYLLNFSIIFGGRAAIPGEFPHMGAIGWRAKNETIKWIFKCGGTLISKNFLLTAAHCSRIPQRNSKDLIQSQPEVVRLGVENIVDDKFLVNGDAVDVLIKRFIVHPKYASPKKYNDIALIELEREVEFKSNIQPACLWPTQAFHQLGRNGTLTGWGHTEKGDVQDVLQAAVVDFIQSQDCDQLLYYYQNRNWQGLRDDQMCAGVLQGGVDTCQGDSGGPLQVNIPLKTKGNMYWALGVTSFGMKCGKMNQPGVYSRVSSYLDWIESIVWPK